MTCFNNEPEVNNIIAKYNEWYNIITKKEKKIRPRTIGCVHIGHCDLCERDDCDVDSERTCFFAQLYYNYGIQICMHCNNREDREFYIYELSLSSNIMSWNLFKSIINLIAPDVNLFDFNIKRSSCIIERWKIYDFMGQITFNVKTEKIVLSVINKAEKIGKGISFKEFCDLNNIDYDKCMSVFREIYFKH